MSRRSYPKVNYVGAVGLGDHVTVVRALAVPDPRRRSYESILLRSSVMIPNYESFGDTFTNGIWNP